MARFLALCIMLVPGILAAWGIKLMRDMMFGVLNAPFQSLSLQFLCGLVFFAGGLSFVAGFIFYRDRKRSKVQERFQKRRKTS
ncbi:DUF2627 domain-containing protein [Metabacillus sp. GX 13764]|uniref:DUF2627 domain-containing protein n=1 Tax=Metabacillus kandeliae TaxID=2900151 RepID=UPI001E3498A0|nr:DUF2627 domain-containing protein [Metabacillus kandeliae]MCD7033222.1 DUF2627 domain-containing protein [Metabacillus kandeliae]